MTGRSLSLPMTIPTLGATSAGAFFTLSPPPGPLGPLLQHPDRGAPDVAPITHTVEPDLLHAPVGALDHTGEGRTPRADGEHAATRRDHARRSPVRCPLPPRRRMEHHDPGLAGGLIQPLDRLARLR